MSVKFEKIETNVVKLEITVEADKFKEAVKKAYQKNGKKFNVPGFRKGKAPMNIITKMYGEGVFYEDALNICYEDTYPEAAKEHDLHPVDYPELDVVQIGQGKDLIYTAKVTVMPEVELGEYKGVEVKKVEYTVTDEDVENSLKGLQEKNARIETKEDGTIEKGDIAVIDFKGFVDGTAFEGGEGNNYSLEIGSKTFIGDFEEQLEGLKVGENKEVKVAFPEQYGREDLNGKPAVFEVTVKEIKAKQIPALDDEFAKEASEFDTIEELKKNTRENLEKANAERTKKEQEEAVVDAVCLNAKVEIPEAMIKREIDNMLKDMEMRLKYQGIDLKTYFQYTNTDEEQMKTFMRDGAQKKVKTELVLSQIAKAEKVEANDEEVKEKATEYAKQYGGENLEKTVDMLIKGQGEYLKLDIISEKVVKMLVENSKIQ
jgi:trigger factor